MQVRPGAVVMREVRAVAVVEEALKADEGGVGVGVC